MGTDGLNIILTTFKMMKLSILMVCLSGLYLMKDVKSFGIRLNNLEPEESKNFGRGPVQTLEAMIERVLGPLDILERFERSPHKGKKHACEEESMESEESEEEEEEGSKEGKKHSK